AGGAVERFVGGLMSFRAHDIGNAKPLLVLVLGLDHPQHHHAAADPHRPARGVIDGAIPLRGVVNDDKAFWLVTRFVSVSLTGHACPGAANRRMLPHSLRLWVEGARFLAWRFPAKRYLPLPSAEQASGAAELHLAVDR